MTPNEARTAVLDFLASHKVNKVELARQLRAQFDLRVSRQSLEQWFSGQRTPREPEIWVQIASVLEIGTRNAKTDPSSLARAANRLALLVMDMPDAPAPVRSAAAEVLKEIVGLFLT